MIVRHWDPQGCGAFRRLDPAPETALLKPPEVLLKACGALGHRQADQVLGFQVQGRHPQLQLGVLRAILPLSHTHNHSLTICLLGFLLACLFA